MCDVCNSESGSTDVGVAALPCGPMSVMWCKRCLQENAIPDFAANYLYIHVAGGVLSDLHESVLNYRIWENGVYIPFEEYVKRFTPEIVQAELAEYQRALEEKDSAHT